MNASAIDNVFDFATEKGGFDTEIDAARAELAQLRVEAAELKAARDEAGAVYGVPLTELIHEMQDAHDFCRQRGDALEAAVNEARKVIERCSAYIGSIDHGENTKSYTICDAWLAAHPAPAPQADQEEQS